MHHIGGVGPFRLSREENGMYAITHLSYRTLLGELPQVVEETPIEFFFDAGDALKALCRLGKN